MDRVIPADQPVVLPFMHAKTSPTPPIRRLPFTKRLPDQIRILIVAVLGEFVGTFLFLFFAFAATQVANASANAASLSADPAMLPSLSLAPNVGVLLFIALAFGFSLMVNVWVFFRISGGAFNPAVTFALCLIGACDWVKGLFVVLSQIVGAVAAAAVVSGLFPGELAVRTRLSGSPGTSVTRGLFIEMFLTAELVFAILMLAAEKHRATFLAPVGIGLALFVAELAGVHFTGGSLNPARSFGPDAVLGTFDGYHWIYWVGPALGSILAVLFYRLIKILEYETCNPDAEADRRRSVAATASSSVDPARVGTDGRFVPQKLTLQGTNNPDQSGIDPIEMKSYTDASQARGSSPSTAAMKRLGLGGGGGGPGSSGPPSYAPRGVGSDIERGYGSSSSRGSVGPLG